MQYKTYCMNKIHF